MCPGCSGTGKLKTVDCDRSPTISCFGCDGAGVLYVQADIDAKDREIEIWKKVARELAWRVNPAYCHTWCAYGDGAKCIKKFGKPCPDGLIEFARKEAEKELKEREGK